MNRLSVLTVLFLGFILSNANAQASTETQSPVVAVPIITQLVKKDEAQNKWTGPLIDLLGEVEKKAGTDLNLRLVPFKRAIAMTKEGEADFGVFMESPKRNKMAMPIMKLGEALFVIVSLKDSAITDLNQLEHKVVGRIRGGTDVKSLKALSNMKYHFFNNHEDGVRLLKAGRIDALLTADFRVLDAIENFGLSFKEIARPLSVEPRELWLYWSWESKQPFELVRNIKNLPALTFRGMDTGTLYDSYKQP
ncbi:exported hypothetical protein [Candidatus Terasakiella magnetica]|uniref:Uncharacterized protein n=2 Tax=Candidatus Terasakiella magnetica TaxID=1867952 RepID=A0A1C3RLX1_9PROT|nr:exported hypothetical protein [Candidatus Terasakiella magnetica]